MALIETNEGELIDAVALMMDGIKVVHDDRCIGSSLPYFCDDNCMNCRFPGIVIEASKRRITFKMEPIFRRV